MHSGLFSHPSPKACAEVLVLARGGSTSVFHRGLDLDEELYRKGKWVVRLYAEAKVQLSPRWMQGSKMRVEASGEEEIIQGLADRKGDID